MSTIFIHAAGDCDIVRIDTSWWSASESGFHFNVATPATARMLRDALTRALERLDAKYPDAKVFADGADATRAEARWEERSGK